MAKVRPTYILLRNFRSFAGVTKIELPKTGLVSIEGPSGSGKSNIVKALAYALDYESTPSTKLRTWLNEQPWGVQVGFDVDGKAVSRSLGSKTLLRVDGEPDTTTASASTERMGRLLGGLEPDTLKAMTYRQQQRAGAFLSQPDAKKRAFLIKVVPALGRFEDELESSVKNTSFLEKQKLELEAKMSAYSEALGEKPDDPIDTAPTKLKLENAIGKKKMLAQMLNSCLMQESADLDQTMAPFQQRVEEAERAVLSLPGVESVKETTELAEAKAVYEEGIRRYRLLLDADKKARAEVENERREIDQKIEWCREAGRKAESAENELASMRHDLEHLSGNKCPRCGQQWLAAVKEAEQLRTVFIPGLVYAIAGERAKEVLKEELEKSKRVHVESPKLKEAQDLQAGLLRAVTVEETKLTTRDKTLRAEHEAKLAQLKVLVFKAKEEASDIYRSCLNDPSNVSIAMKIDLAQLEKEVSEITQVLEHNEQQARSSKHAIKSWNERAKLLDTTKLALDELLAKFNAEADYADLLKSFVGAAFEEVLEEIAHEANEVLMRVENTQSVSIRFDTEKTNADGKVSSRIVPVVSVRGHEATPSDLSGGMGTMLDLAVDLLAIGDVAARRTGFEPAWLVLDESFDGMGSRDREGCMEILRQHAEKKLILVVTHSIEFKDLFAKRIKVGINSDGSSFLEEVGSQDAIVDHA